MKRQYTVRVEPYEGNEESIRVLVNEKSGKKYLCSIVEAMDGANFPATFCAAKSLAEVVIARGQVEADRPFSITIKQE